MYCNQCGGPSPDDATFCSRCGRQVATPVSVVTRSEKNAGLAAVLSFFWCGLGQIYNGQIAKGVVMMIVYVFAWLLCFIVLGFFIIPVLWIWGMVDAYQTAEKINTTRYSGVPELNA